MVMPKEHKGGAGTGLPNGFSALALPEPLLRVLSALGYREPTPVQRQAIPAMLAGHDVIARSETGSGKTAAFSIPLLERVDPGVSVVQGLVLCPTRDLCNQVMTELRSLGRYRPHLRVLGITGGVPLGPQRQALERGVHILVATPGRLLDHLARDSLRLDALRVLVLDEADRMLDMGFRDAVASVVAATPVQRQTALFSATFDDAVRELSTTLQRDPVRVEASVAIDGLRQRVHRVSLAGREDALLAVLAGEQLDPVMVFCNTREAAERVAGLLQERGMAADCLHGGRDQAARDLAVARFRNASTRILVATDVAARGLDIDGVATVINLGLPEQPEFFTHRIGRTGRAGGDGLAISLVGEEDRQTLAALGEQGVSLPETAPLPEASLGVDYGTTMQTLLISAGRREKLRPADLLGALTGEAGLQAGDVGRIEISASRSYVAVNRQVAKRALVRLRQGRIKNRKFRVHLV